VLGDTSLPTASALERSEVLVRIMVNITEGEGEVTADKIVKFCSSVSSEEEQLQSLKHVLGTQGTLRPIFESLLKQKRLVRNRAMSLRRTVAEAGLDYEALGAAVRDGSLRKTLEATGATEEDIGEMVKLIEEHFSPDNTPSAGNIVTVESDQSS